MFDDFYGLTGRPFQLTPDPNFYFESATHRKALSYLGYGMAQSEGFIVITGEVGAGKSTLVAHLMQKIDREQMTVGQVVTSNLDGEELVHVVAQSFGLEVQGHDKASALGAIENFLHEEAREGRRTLLIVDESQNLSVEALEELRMLSNFQLGSHPLLQLLLLGQPEFKQVLAEHSELEQLRQRVIAAHHLQSMEPSEIEPYIKHRLECVGWTGNPDFDQRVFAGLYEATRGIPRRVNQVVTRLLLLGAVEQRTRIDNAMLTAVLDEMKGDSAFPEAAPKPMEKLAPAPAPGPIKHVAEPRLDQAKLEEILAERDNQIAELQQAVVELSRAVEGQPTGSNLSEDALARIASFERKLEEQERGVRNVLAMLIEWMESGQQSREAA
ncbi:XrtA/PEP-CTERM system-associated ATPase [Pontixanthobacter gangjinensis]|uniref:AAA family ATPase n=1 Tax=Pontixanthobacter gangjinensis TaxID=1028742 RepID=A0A6I4SNC3_9SPHN|nr:XrtA/PEP-CTERM system-associated ATPase [Pontixanthobacter gangjinensis]MXO56868.1 AAA family ATPase [Pontixanthobacter gangjinensis]